MAIVWLFDCACRHRCQKNTAIRESATSEILSEMMSPVDTNWYLARLLLSTMAMVLSKTETLLMQSGQVTQILQH